MSVSTNIQDVIRASVLHCGAGEFHGAFDSVTVYAADGGYVCMFLPEGKGQAVADAINAALVPAPAPEKTDA